MADDPNTISTSSLAGPISPLRQRMIGDMTIRRLAPGTQAAYLSAVSRFSRHFGRSPDKLSYEDVRAWQLHLVQSGLAASAVNNQITALRFFFRVTLGQRDASQMIPQARQPERLREVLRPDEVARLIEAAQHPKYRAALSLAYGAGLRVSEVIGIKVSDIDSKRMVLRIENGKGGRDRLAKLSPLLLEGLRAWWKAARPRVYLVPNPDERVRSHQRPPVHARLSDRRRQSQARQASQPAHASAFLRHAPARCRGRYQGDPGDARPQTDRDDHDLCGGLAKTDPEHRRSVRAACPQGPA
jgi:site-specific recombinase XerD